ncbi:MAG: DUF6526 family protein [Luteibaculaceae bacterium]
MAQNFKNHLRFNPLHHFIIIPIALGLLVYGLVRLFQAPTFDNAIFVLVKFLLVCIAMIARLYALKTQDRLIRLEMRQRYFELSGKRFAEVEKKLRLSQIIALRFADDAQLLELIDKAMAEGLSATEIKKQVKNWQADTLRV